MTIQTAAAPFDTARAEGFAERLLGMYNHGALCLMISIGHRTGLFDTMAVMPPASSAEIARQAGLQERYVREWLGAMTVGDIVEHDPAGGTYWLAAEHAASLTRASPTENLAIFGQYFGVLGGIEDDLVACFRDGGGVPYERYGRFHEVMAEDSGQSVLPALESHILPLVPGLIERLEAGIRVLDAGCGRGQAVNLLAARFPNSRFVGYDLSAEAIDFARAEARRRGNGNATFEARDLSDFDLTAPAGAFDLVTTFDAVHDQKDPQALLRGIRRALAPDSVYIAQDIKGTGHHHLDRDHVLGPLLYTVSCMHCMTVSLAQGGEGLGTMWGKETALKYFRAAGFADIDVHEFEHDVMNYWYVCRP
jgi:SAM-dependent methyltransferase